METKFKAVDFFAGIGGLRLGFEQAFGDLIHFIFSNDINPYCYLTYKKNFGKVHKLYKKNILDIDIDRIPDFNILLAGFPCQTFSIAGRKDGFNDDRGKLFFHLAEIIDYKEPDVFLLENVKHLIYHDKGQTFSIIKDVLEKELDYHLHYKILDAKDFGLPQRRERLYIIGFKKHLEFRFPTKKNNNVNMKSILQNRVNIKYYLSQQYLNSLINHKKRHKNKGNGFGYWVLDPSGIANTIVCGGMGKERNLVKDEIFYDPWKPGDDPFKKKNNQGIRNLTVREWARLQGFPDEFKFPISMTQAYKQIANSVPVPVIENIALEMKKSLCHTNKK